MRPQNECAPNFMYDVAPHEVISLARRAASTPFSELSLKDKQLFVRVAACRYCTELYLFARAEAEGRKIVFVECGKPVAAQDLEEEDFGEADFPPMGNSA